MTGSVAHAWISRLEQLRDLAAEGTFDVLLVTARIASPAATPIRSC